MSFSRGRSAVIALSWVFASWQPLLSAPLDGAAREWEFSYRATIRNIPDGARSVRMWVPLPREGDGQSISELKVETHIPYRRVTDSEYGNVALLLETDQHLPDSVPLTITFRVRRSELGATLPIDTGMAFATIRRRLLAPDALIPVDGAIAELALRVVKGETTDRDKAKAIYDYILGTMRYDKSGTGWGRGDALFACDERRGNCTDIHSLLIGMARATGIPARFVMGFPVPRGEDKGSIEGYHCWADLYLEGIGWVPIDASEAIKHRDMAGYYFGKVDPNRVAFTVGRDIKLGEGVDAPRVNYFIYPIVQVDDREHTDVVHQITFRALRREADAGSTN